MSDSINSSQPDDDVDLRRYAQVLARHLNIIVAGAAAGVLLAVGVVSLRPRLFQATANLITVPGERLPAGLTAATAKALLVSPEIASETLNALGPNRDGMTVRRFIDDSVDIQLTPGANLMTISVALPDPARARAAAELLATKIVDAHRNLDERTASDGRARVVSPLEDADRGLQEAEKKLAEFQANAELELLEAEFRSSNERRSRLADLGISLDSERARLAALEQELARHPPVPARASPETVRDTSGSTGPTSPQADLPWANSIGTLLEHDIAQSRATIARTRAERDRMVAAGSEPAAGDRWARLHRLRLELARLRSEYEARSRAYNLALSRYVPSAADLATARLQLVSRPVQPDEPMSAQRIRFALLGGVLGFVAGVVAGLIVDRRRDSRVLV